MMFGKPIKYYLLAVINVLVLVFVFGFAAPRLVSVSDDFSAIAGVTLMILTPIVLWLINYPTVKQLFGKKSKKRGVKS